MRLVGHHARGGGGRVLLPGLLELRPIAFRTVAVEEFPVPPDAGGDEIFRRLVENGTPLLGVRPQQRVAAPTLEPGGELPPEIGHVIQSVVEAV